MREELRQEIAVQMDYLEKTVAHLNALVGKVADTQPDNDQMAAVGAYLMNFYSGVENVLKTLLRACNRDIPDGPDWHVQLLGMFGPEGETALPRLFDSKTMEGLDTYRAFRHVFMHGYAILLRWDRLRPNAERVAAIFTFFRARVEDCMNRI